MKHIFRSKIPIKDSMARSRRRMKVFIRKLRAEMEHRIPGIEFIQFEVVHKKDTCKIIIQPTIESANLMNEWMKTSNASDN